MVTTNEKFARQIKDGVLFKKKPPGIIPVFQVQQPPENLRNRECTTLHVPQCRTDSIMRMPSYTVPKIYNDLQSHFKNQDTFLLKENLHLNFF
jgi:hypothetical protein